MTPAPMISTSACRLLALNPLLSVHTAIRPSGTMPQPALFCLPVGTQLEQMIEFDQLDDSRTLAQRVQQVKVGLSKSLRGSIGSSQSTQ